MKKVNIFLGLALVFSLIIPVSNQPHVSADTLDNKITFQTSEITDEDQLLERAENNISDLPKSELPEVAKQQTVIKGKEGSKKFETLTTTQLLKEITKSDNTRVKTFATTNFGVVEESDLIETNSTDNVSVSSTSGSKSKDKDDKSYGVKAYNTIYYDVVYDSNGVKHIDLNKVTGGWSLSDNSLTLSNRKVNYGARGASNFGSTSGQSATRYPSYNSYTYYAPSLWVPVNTTSGWYAIGSNSWIDISRSSSTWTLHLQNNY